MKIIQAARGRPRIILSAVVLAAAALVTLMSQAASARTVTPAASVTKTGSASGSEPGARSPNPPTPRPTSLRAYPNPPGTPGRSNEPSVHTN